MMTKQDSEKIAGRHYEPSDYKRSSSLSSALATTHEQVSDAYMEGTVEAVIDDANGKERAVSQRENE
jgi:hypothetical protein